MQSLKKVLLSERVGIRSCASCLWSVLGDVCEWSLSQARQLRAALALVVGTEFRRSGLLRGVCDPAGGFSHKGNGHWDHPSISFLFFSPSFA